MERRYNKQTYIAMQEKIKSLEEKNKKLTTENESLSSRTKHFYSENYRLKNECLKSLDKLESLREKIKSLEEKNKRLSVEKDSLSYETALQMKRMERKFNLGRFLNWC